MSVELFIKKKKKVKQLRLNPILQTGTTVTLKIIAVFHRSTIINLNKAFL